MAADDSRPGQSVHLRTACDPCSNAKVRCDKKHPACDRCAQSNTACWYSESRKHGKQTRRKRLVAYDDRLNRASAAATAKTAAPPPSAEPATTSPIGGGPGGAWNGLLPSPSSIPAMEMDGIEGDQVLESLLNNSRNGSTASNDALSSWSFADAMGMDMDMTSFTDWHVSDIPCPSMSTTSPQCPPPLPPQTHRHDKPVPGPPGYELGDEMAAAVAAAAPRIRGGGFAPPNNTPATSTPTTSTNTTTTTNTTNTNTNTNTVSTHDCEAKAISILRSMQHGQVQQGMTTCSAEPPRYPNLNLHPSFDRVLSTNKAALNAWGQLMECSCAQCPHLVLLYVSILTKMLFWYRVAAVDTSTKTMKQEPSSRYHQDTEEEEEDHFHHYYNHHSPRRINNGLPSPHDSSSTTPSQDSASEAAAAAAPPINRFGIRPTAIRVGSLHLDPEDEASLRRVLLLGELRKTEAAINQLTAVDRSVSLGDESPNNASMRRAVQWGLSGVACVREELQEVMQLVSNQSR